MVMGMTGIMVAVVITITEMVMLVVVMMSGWDDGADGDHGGGDNYGDMVMVVEEMVMMVMEMVVVIMIMMVEMIRTMS